MQSKTSCFNAAIYKKNLTRFAPVWLLYTLVLVLMVFLSYHDAGKIAAYRFAYGYASLVGPLAVINLGYALLTAQLLFGDLFNPRMCNAIHALPVRREGLFLTNVLSGLTVSLVPTAIMAALALVLVRSSVFTNAPQMVLLVFLGANLEFLCFFGMAVFCVMCTGNRFAMTAGYGLLNAWAYIGYFLADGLYTPLLYGVITPTTMVVRLTPLTQMLENPFIKPAGKYRSVLDNSGNLIPGITDSFTFVAEDWQKLGIWAAAGIVFALLALALYRRRNLECAGDAVAFPVLVPVFQVPCAIVVAAVVSYAASNIVGYMDSSYLVYAVGLTVGWFVGKMLTYRSTRVFQVKNWAQLGILTAVIAASLFATKLDIFGIETWQPDLADIEVVEFGTGYTANEEYTDPEDWEAILTLQQLALEEQLEDDTPYVPATEAAAVDSDIIVQEESEARISTSVHIVYKLKNGRDVKRRYNIWPDQPEGDIARQLLSRWENVAHNMKDVDGNKVDRLNMVLSDFRYLRINRVDDKDLEPYQTVEDARSLIAALQADCAAGNLAQDPYLHRGHFRYEDTRYDRGFYTSSQIYVNLESRDWGWSVSIFPDCTNTLRWMEDRGLLNMEIRPENIP